MWQAPATEAIRNKELRAAGRQSGPWPGVRSSEGREVWPATGQAGDEQAGRAWHVKR